LKFQLLSSFARILIDIYRCCLIVKTLYGGLAEAICEELFSYGQLTCSDTIRKVSARLEQPLADFVMRCPPVASSLKGCPQFEDKFDPFIMPDLLLQSTAEPSGDSRKRKAQSDGDEGIYWKINWSRFDRYIRDDLTLELLVPKRPDVEKSLRTLVDDSQGVVRKTGDSGGGLFIIDFERATQQMCQYHIESLIREQLETRAVRIFRLLQQKGHLEEEQIEKLTMMGSKETRELLYAMLEEGYIHTKPIGRTNDFAPSRTFVLYYVDFAQTVRAHEAKEHRLLTDRQVKMESIIETIDADETLDDETKKQQIAEVEEMYLSKADRQLLEKFRKAQTILNAAETECERALFIFKLFVDYSQRRC
uniref:DNA-directed RNA polymerase III subunit RPC3 n=1 Tax=Nippostrongylus brasiliensis TaxID=27835 RepID=A0A0N4XFW6_NIPBR